MCSRTLWGRAGTFGRPVASKDREQLEEVFRGRAACCACSRRSDVRGDHVARGVWFASIRGVAGGVDADGGRRWHGDHRVLGAVSFWNGHYSSTSQLGQGRYSIAGDPGHVDFVRSDGTTLSGEWNLFGNFHGSTGNLRLNRPVVGLVPTADNHGYWLVAADGGVFSFNAQFHGSMGGVILNRPIVTMVPYGDAYLMVAGDGGVFNFSNGLFFGSEGGTQLPAPIVGGSATG